MKTLALISAAIIVVSCSTPDPDMKGAYKMLSQNLKGDTVDVTNNNPQLKLYTEEYMMYTRYVPEDSVAIFGICAYITNGNEVIESAIYSAAGTTVSDSTQNYQLAIEWMDQGYKQAISSTDANTGKNYVSTEVYETISSDKPSPLDGAWLMTDVYYINAKGDTSFADAVAYKAYYAGRFTFGVTQRDSLNVPHTNIEFGTFEMNGDNAIAETIQVSSWSELAGQTMSVAITWNGPDEFTQRISWTEGSESSTETYKRLGR